MIKDKLINDFSLLQKQLFWVEISYGECSAIGIKESYSIDEFGRFETLCARYARGIDFLIRKIFRTIDEYEFMNQGTLIDVVNNAHKRGLFEDIKNLRIMKDIRNSIAHEYVGDNLTNLFGEVLRCTSELITIINNTLKYIKGCINDLEKQY